MHCMTSVAHLYKLRLQGTLTYPLTFKYVTKKMKVWCYVESDFACLASYHAGVADVLYSDFNSNSPLEGPRVFCTAMFSRIFLMDSTDCRVSALRSFSFQDGCKPHEAFSTYLVSLHCKFSQRLSYAENHIMVICYGRRQWAHLALK